ncbi:KfrB domain-containing protein [Thiolapillus sp.]|uniref:KfrB domain-containing protein n=1 Tax=Thiolapillus sp. TaxID=2017437 RepID=UPI003AF85832
MTRASINAYNGDSSYLANLIRDNLHDRDKALEIAKHAAGDKVQLERAEPGKSYSGRVVGETERYVVQEREGQPGQMVLHNRRSLSGEADKFRGKEVEIRYPHGDVGLVRDAGRGKEAGRDRQHEQQHQAGNRQKSNEREK